MQNFNKSFLIGVVVGFGAASLLFTWTEISLISKNSFCTESSKIKSASTQDTGMLDVNANIKGHNKNSAILEPNTESGQQLRSNVNNAKSPPVELKPLEESKSQPLDSDAPNNDTYASTDNKGNIEQAPSEQQTNSQAVAIEQAPVAPERQEDTNSKAVVIDFDDRNTFVPMEPEYSLHGKTGSWGWHLLSGEEAAQEIHANQNVCNKPFEHCCLGQGRQQVVKMDPYKALWKLINTDDESLQLGTFGDVLKHYPAGQSQESTCTFAFFGDSLSADSAMGAVCEALGMGYTLKSCNTLRMGAMGVYGDDLHYTCEENRYSSEGATTSSHFLLEKEDASYCPRVLIAYFEQDIINGMAFMPPAIVELGGLAIFNWGVHCNADDGCLENALSPILDSAVDKRYRHWRFMFREHEPQHFAVPGGLYPYSFATHEHHICSNFHGRIDNWKNLKVASIIEASFLTKQIAILPISAALEPLVGLHYDGPLLENGDCTHYVYNPHRLDVTWDALLTVLQGK